MWFIIVQGPPPKKNNNIQIPDFEGSWITKSYSWWLSGVPACFSSNRARCCCSLRLAIARPWRAVLSLVRFMDLLPKLGDICPVREVLWNTLQRTNISHLGKRKIIFKMPFLGDMWVPWRVIFQGPGRYLKECHWDSWYHSIPFYASWIGVS